MKGKNYFEKPRFCDVDVVHISDYRATLRADLKIPAVRVCARVCSHVCVCAQACFIADRNGNVFESARLSFHASAVFVWV